MEFSQAHNDYRIPQIAEHRGDDFGDGMHIHTVK